MANNETQTKGNQMGFSQEIIKVRDYKFYRVAAVKRTWEDGTVSYGKVLAERGKGWSKPSFGFSLKQVVRYVRHAGEWANHSFA